MLVKYFVNLKSNSGLLYNKGQVLFSQILSNNSNFHKKEEYHFQAELLSFQAELVNFTSLLESILSLFVCLSCSIIALIASLLRREGKQAIKDKTDTNSTKFKEEAIICSKEKKTTSPPNKWHNITFFKLLYTEINLRVMDLVRWTLCTDIRRSSTC